MAATPSSSPPEAGSSRLRTLRLAAGLRESELARELELAAEDYAQLESDDEALETAITLAQAIGLARLLGTDIPGLLGEPERPAPLPVAELRATVVARIARHALAREALEEEINWDLGAFLDDADDWTQVCTIEFVRSLATALGLDPRRILGGLLRPD